MLGYPIGMLKEFSEDVLEKFIGKVASVFEFYYYDSDDDLPLIPFKDSILFATLMFTMKRHRLTESEAEDYIAKEVRLPSIKKDYIELRQYYPNVLPPLEPCKTEELFAYILLAEPIIRSKSEYNVGRSINRLFVELLRGQESVYDWGFAQGQFLIQSLLRNSSKPQVSGIEVKESNYVVTKIRMCMVGEAAELQLGNLFIEKQANSEGAAAVICSPRKNPLTEIQYRGIYLQSSLAELFYISSDRAMHTGEWPYVLKALDSLQPGGKLMALTSTEAASDKLYKTIRRKLLEEGLVESVILLSNRLIPGNKKAHILWIFSKKDNRHVRMINAGEIRTKREPVYYLSDENIKQIANLYRYGEKYMGTVTDDEDIIEDIVRDVAVEDLLKDPMSYRRHHRFDDEEIVNVGPLGRDEGPQCDLAPDRYTNGSATATTDAEELFKGPSYFLGDVCKIRRGADEKVAESGAEVDESDTADSGDLAKYITPKHLNNRTIDVLKMPSLTTATVAGNRQPLKINTIIMSKSAPFKFGFIDDLKGRNVYCSGNTYKLTVDENEINPIYLFMYLTSDLAKEQLTRISETMNPSSRTKTISITDLGELQIPMLPREEQERLAKEFLKMVAEEEKIQRQLDKISEGKEALIQNAMAKAEQED